MTLFSNINPLFLLFTLSVIFMLIMWKLSNRLVLSKQINLTRLFLLGAAPFIALAGLVSLVFGNSAFDIQQHDTYYVVEHAHLLMLVAVIFLVYAGFYQLFSFLSRKEMNETMGKMHFLGTIVSMYAMLLLTCYSSMISMLPPRRYYQFGEYDAVAYFTIVNIAITMVAITFILIQIIPFINAIYSLIYGKRIIR